MTAGPLIEDDTGALVCTIEKANMLFTRVRAAWIWGFCGVVFMHSLLMSLKWLGDCFNFNFVALFALADDEGRHTE